jgi:hypothetical protein
LVLVLVAAGGMGKVWADRTAEQDRISELTRQAEELNAKATEFKDKLRRIREKDTTTVEAYYAQALEVEELLNNNASLFERRHQLIEQFTNATKGNPRFQTMLARVQQVYGKDDEVIVALREEIRDAKDLMNLPASKRGEFYAARIEPIEQRIQQLANEETLLMQHSAANAEKQ